MKIRVWVAATAAAALVVVGSRLLNAQGTQTEFRALSKVVRGTQAIALVSNVACPDGHRTVTRRHTIRASVASFECDERPCREELNGTNNFSAVITVVRREGFPANTRSPVRGCFSGTWRIATPTGVTLASGFLEGTTNAGTHNVVGPNCESCGPLGHFEGVLRGACTLPGRPQIPIRCASIQGIGLHPETGQNFQMRIEGVKVALCTDPH